MKESKILVVGGAGYIGSHMVKMLLKKGASVITLDNLSTGHRELLPGGEFLYGNLGDTSILNSIFSEHNIDAVMHFAAYSLVGESVKEPMKYYHNNVAATIELLSAMIRHNVKRFIFSSSAAVYGDSAEIPITENQPSIPTNPYGATKAVVEGLLDDCDAAYGLKYASLRYFNAAGADESGKIGEKHEPESHLIPLTLKVAAGTHKHIEIFGTGYPTPDGTCIRDYIHVNDLARAHLLTLEALFKGMESSIYNLGSSRGYSVREVIELARKVTGHPIDVVETGRRAGDPAVLIASSNKIREELGWEPRYEDLENIIKTAWVWHRREKKCTKLDEV